VRASYMTPTKTASAKALGRNREPGEGDPVPGRVPQGVFTWSETLLVTPSSIAQSHRRFIAAMQADRALRNKRGDDSEIRRARGAHPGARASEKPAESGGDSTLIQLHIRPCAEPDTSDSMN
jgi:hypothetical protein